MSRTYRPQRIGGSIYLCIPPSFFTPAMLKKIGDKSVRVRLTLLRKGARECIFKMEEVDEKHDIGVKADRENALEFRFADFIREVNRPE